MKEKHVIIIGSGLGGLVCGYILAKNGYRVSVLEKNAQMGGCLQTFSRHGIKYETGMHYIGSMDEGQILYKYFDYLALLPDVPLQALDKTAYEIISIAGKRFHFANGREHFVESLSRHFPNERANLERYCRTVHDVATHSLHSLQHNYDALLQNARSVNGWIESAISDKLLQQILAGNLPLYAGIKDKTPFYIHALISDFYNRSAYRIVGGSDVIVRSLVNSIRSMGGTVRTDSQVSKINCNTTNAVSAVLTDGEEIGSDFFISAIHPVRTLEMLGNTPLIRKAYRERIRGLDNTVSNFTLYLQFKRNTLPYMNSNFYHYNDTVWGCENYTPNDWPKNFLYMHLCSSAGQKYADAAVIISYMNFEDVSRWQHTRVGCRGDEYESFKQQKAERLLESLERQMPGTRENIERYYTSTPLTYLNYTGTENGATYGILHDCNHPVQSSVSQRTKIPNLFLTGQNTSAHGILGVIIGAMITSGELMQVRYC
ncbi:MAG: NAD(P)/FAD-dependent oxidoreductase [Dysgonamonadaceae bacterium]|jgi:all-trans-retinol 13,14-reductase|nr:NAD(P)/FAD-dependent oxidoreductase [Dysgonamonadaceae bacterium]